MARCNIGFGLEFEEDNNRDERYDHNNDADHKPSGIHVGGVNGF